MTAWNGTRNLVARLLYPTAASRPRQEVRRPGELLHLGYDDLAGQLRGALDRFDKQGVRVIPFEVFFLLAVAYILVISLGDYLFLKNCAKRMERSWLTFPLMVVLACFGAYYLARWSRGDHARINQLSMVDIDSGTGQFRATSWFAIMSPETEVFDIGLQVERKMLPAVSSCSEGQGLNDESEVLLSWLGRPGGGLGGMQSVASAPRFTAPYTYGPELENLRGVPIEIWSTKSFCGRVHGKTQMGDSGDLAMSQSSPERILTGTVTNPTSLELADCVLMYDRWVYLLGDLRPGQRMTVDEESNIRAVSTYLTRLGDWESESDDERKDPMRILQRMIFYEAAGGLDYVPLENDYQSFVDMTPLLQNGKAVLVGRAPGNALVVNGAGRPIGTQIGGVGTLVRVVLSVDKLSDEPAAAN